MVDHLIPFSKVSEKQDLVNAFEKLEIKADIKDPDAKWAIASADSNLVHVTEREVIENLVPRVVGMGAMDALFLLENAGMKVNMIGSGVVRQQSILPGTRATSGREIVIRLS